MWGWKTCKRVLCKGRQLLNVCVRACWPTGAPGRPPAIPARAGTPQGRLMQKRWQEQIILETRAVEASAMRYKREMDSSHRRYVHKSARIWMSHLFAQGKGALSSLLATHFRLAGAPRDPHLFGFGALRRARVQRDVGSRLFLTHALFVRPCAGRRRPTCRRRASC